jgi:hypothetical protein
VGRIAPLGDDAFQPHGTGQLQKLRTVSVQLFAQSDQTLLLADISREHVPPLLKR